MRYNKGNDTSWVINFANEIGRTLAPGDTTNLEIVDTQDIHIRSIEYWGQYHGKVIHELYDTSFIMPYNKLTKVILANFYIPPPWWMSWWFITLSFITVAIITFFIIRQISFLKLKRKQEILQQELKLQNERIRISSEMHDDIGSSLAGIKLQMEVLNQKLLTSDIHDEISQINNSMGVLCSKVREVIWSIDSENDTLQNLTSFIYQQTHRLFDKTLLNATVSIPENIPELVLNGEKRRHIYLIVKEALHNVIKHSNATNVSIIFTINIEELIITIKDNGKGFDASAKNTTVESMGLRSIRNRAKSLDALLNIESSKNGTVIYLNMPFSNNIKDA